MSLADLCMTAATGIAVLGTSAAALRWGARKARAMRCCARHPDTGGRCRQSAGHGGAHMRRDGAVCVVWEGRR